MSSTNIKIKKLNPKTPKIRVMVDYYDREDGHRCSEIYPSIRSCALHFELNPTTVWKLAYGRLVNTSKLKYPLPNDFKITRINEDQKRYRIHRQLGGEWVECPDCHRVLRPHSISSHLKTRQHKKDTNIFQMRQGTYI